MAPIALSTQITISNEVGLHARPATLFVQTAQKFSAQIRVAYHGSQVDAKSLLSILGLGVASRDTILVEAQGPDAEAALAALTELAATGFENTVLE